jgi:hypothetical protein
MFSRIYPAFVAACFCSTALAQPSPEELRPLLAGFEDLATLDKRVPLSTNDPTVSPLIDLQVFAPPVTPRNGKSCTVNLLQHSFGTMLTIRGALCIKNFQGMGHTTPLLSLATPLRQIRLAGKLANGPQSV